MEAPASDALMVESAQMLDSGDSNSATSESSGILDSVAGQTENVSSDPASAARLEVVFLDTSVDDYQQLLEDLWSSDDPSRQFEVVLLQNSRDGIEQVSETLAGRSDLDAVHFVTHGTDGRVKLGGTWLDINNLGGYAGEIAGWGNSLTADADLLFYGCDLASNSDGQELIDSIGTLTGADVAASTDDTGAAILGGDWELEYQIGLVESEGVFSVDVHQNWSNLLAASSPGTAIWNENGTTTPEYNDFDGTSFGTEANSTSVGEWEVIQGAEAPTRDEKIVVGIQSGKTITGQMWNGSSWSALSINPLGDAKNSESFSFAVEYESQSGDAVLVWNDSPDLKFSVWDGTSWTAPATVAAYTGGDPTHMRLASSPNSDEMVLILSDDGSKDDYALVWDGSSWGNQIQLTTVASQGVTDVSVAYEQQSGHAMVVYAKDQTDVHYRTWNGSSWSSEGTLTAPSGPAGKALWTMIDSDPTSDRIVLGVLTESDDAYLAVWDGSTWNASDKLSATLDVSNRNVQNLAVAFESESGQALATYAENGNSVIQYHTWTSGSGWTGALAGPDLGDDGSSMTLDADPTTDNVMLSVVDQGNDVSFVLWNGSSWGTPSEQEIDAGLDSGQPFLFLFDVDVATPIGHWTFDTDATDSSGNSYDGTLTNGAVINTDSGTNQIGGGKVSLDGSNDYVNISSHIANFQNLTEGTITAWVYSTATNTDVIFEASDKGDTNSRLALIRESDGSLEFFVREGGTVLLDVSTAAGTIPQGTWTHVAVSVSATGNALYVNGTQVTGGSLTYTTGSAATNVFFDDVTNLDFMAWGVDRRTPDDPVFRDEFEGFVDDARVYDTALSASDIADLPGVTSQPVAVSFQNGVNSYTGTQDTELDSGSATTDKGSNTSITIDLDDGSGEAQGLIRFDGIVGSDPGDIPQGVQITSASLSVNGTDNTSNTISLHRMLQTWSESSTWDSLTGGLTANDTELTLTPDSQVVAPVPGTITFTGLESTVQAWVNGETNYGWGLLSNGTDGWDFDSSEGTTPPLLSVSYIDPGSQLSTTHTLTVDTASDVQDGDTTSIDALLANKGADGFISLREAIWAANNTQNLNTSTPDVINFAIGSGLQTITLASPLPALTDAVTLDATTQTGYAGTPLIQLDGSSTSTFSTAGILIWTSDSTVKGFIIHSFDDEGIEIDGNNGHGPADNNIIEDNWIGINSTQADAGNGDHGVLVTDGAASNIIRNNVIAGNSTAGIVIRNSGTDGNIVQGNYIGTNAASSLTIGNSGNNVEIFDGASNNIIGGSGVGEANVIGQAGNDGITIYNSGTQRG